MSDDVKIAAAVDFLQQLGFENPADYAQQNADRLTAQGDGDLAALRQKIANQARSQSLSRPVFYGRHRPFGLAPPFPRRGNQLVALPILVNFAKIVNDTKQKINIIPHVSYPFIVAFEEKRIANTLFLNYLLT